MRLPSLWLSSPPSKDAMFQTHKRIEEMHKAPPPQSLLCLRRVHDPSPLAHTVSRHACGFSAVMHGSVPFWTPGHSSSKPIGATAYTFRNPQALSS